MQPELKPVRTDDQAFGRTTYDAARDVAVSADSAKVLRNTYMLLALTSVLMIGLDMMMALVAMPIQAPITVGTIVRASSR